MTPTDEPELPGYVVLELLHHGVDLDVFDVWSTLRQCRCVVKMCRPDRRRPTLVQRLRDEGALLCRFTHPHLVRGYEVIKAPEVAIVLETLTGMTLECLLESSPRLDRRSLANLGAQLASALNYLHAQGWLHLDLKPANVIAEAGKAKLIDLSLVQAPGPVNRGLGTHDYLAPEQALGGSADAATDVWGLGLVLYEAATGVAPFDTDDHLGTAAPYRQLCERASPVKSLRRLPRDLACTIDACLEIRPADRPTLTEISAVCDRHANGD